MVNVFETNELMIALSIEINSTHRNVLVGPRQTFQSILKNI